MHYLTKPSPEKIPVSYNWLSKCGWLPIKFHYYQSIIRKEMLPENFEKIENPLIGINLNVENQLKLLEEFSYNAELEKISERKKNDFDPYFNNQFFSQGSDEIYYNMIRYFKPKIIVEIGAGESTKFANLAIKQNNNKFFKNEHFCIEPYENQWLQKLNIDFIRKPVEKIGIDFFEKLSENDILFIDSSHVIRSQGDVVHEYLNIIPSLKKGVIIHCHDIFLPKEYPINWIVKEKRFWNEQYLLQALLTHSSRYKILLACNYLSLFHDNKLQKCCPNYQKNNIKGNSSFWFQVV